MQVPFLGSLAQPGTLIFFKHRQVAILPLQGVANGQFKGEKMRWAKLVGRGVRSPMRQCF